MIWDVVYWLKRTPWDTGITPPEVVEAATRRFPKGGRALDIGCGTGANAVYLAQHGFRVLGIDVSRRAIALARRRAQQAGVVCELRVANMTQLDQLTDVGPFDLALDIGCFHSLSVEGRRAYAHGLRDRVVRGGMYLLYAFCPGKLGLRPIGVSPDEVGSLFADGFLIHDVKLGEDSGNEHASAWYTLQRV
ncbi:MAG TPA: methyltransferase domain-containing protein [Anaerolineae bacterium]|nr:methyltransferase domain-containing protein [Anaerolineae bacterium]